MINKNLQNKLNHYGCLKEPFLFLISYDMKNDDFILLKDLKAQKEDIKFEINQNVSSKSNEKINFLKEPISFERYEKKFDILQEHIKAGNSYLLNLTCKTKIQTNLSLDEIYEKAQARFKIKYKNEFVSFSPERFIEIKHNRIYTYPMKGTIDSSIANAKEIILADEKEMAEHTMVVDLLRNDLSIVSKQVRVDRFRYIDEINAGNKKLLQVSSQISGQLKNNWNSHIGNIFNKLLPAGSITGTPKKKTLDILNEVENYDREYYTGIAGIFDGEKLETFVLIRFIEKKDSQLFYKSGGGITCDSDAKAEYEELIHKIYIPS